MKRNVKVAFCALMAALSTVFMLLSYFPYFTYAVPAFSGLLIMVVLIEVGGKWPIITYIVTSVLVFMFAETEAKLMYILLFGYYPAVKAYIERIGNRFLQYLIKFAVFNEAVIVLYGVLAKVLGLDIIWQGEYGYLTAIAFLVLGNITFWLYDKVLVRMAAVYLSRIHPAVAKIFKNR